MKRRLAKTPRGLVAVLLSSTLVVTTALVGLVVEDFLRHEEGQSTIDPGHFTVPRLSFTVASVAILWCLSWLVTFQRRTNGTLYYLRILDERATDLHKKANAHSQKRSLDYRSVKRSIDLGTGRTVDVAQVVEEARADLERAAATDDQSSAFELAPNAHWPIEFAIGYQWPLPDTTVLIEFDRDQKDPSFTEPSQVSESLQEIWSPNNRDFDSTLVHLDIHLSVGPPLSDHQVEAIERQLFGRTADSTVLVGWGTNGPTDGAARQAVAVGKDGVCPREAAELIARTMLEALDKHPRASVAVTLNTPKSVGVLAGRYVAAYLQKPNSGDQSRHWISPWRRLHLVARNKTNFSAGTEGQAQIMRVHSSQPIEPPWWQPIPAGGVVVNLTPHDLAVYEGDQIALSAPRSSVPARIAEMRDEPGMVSLNGCATTVVDVAYLDDVTGLPDPVDGTFYVVSRITAQALRRRSDLLFPLDEVRNDDAQIIGCRALGRFRHRVGE